jgi:hypothetical protein
VGWENIHGSVVCRELPPPFATSTSLFGGIV